MELGLPPTVGSRGAAVNVPIAMTQQDHNGRSHVSKNSEIRLAIAVKVAHRECTRILVYCRRGGGLEGTIALTEKDGDAAVIGTALEVSATRLSNRKIRLAIPVKVRGDEFVKNLPEGCVLFSESQAGCGKCDGQENGVGLADQGCASGLITVTVAVAALATSE